MRALVSAACALCATIGAGGMARGADYMPPPVAVVSAWTGFYVGGSVGSRWTRADWNTIGFNSPGFGFGPFAQDNRASLDSLGIRFGGYVGYNQQIGNAVLGVEADFGTASSRQSMFGIPGADIGVGDETTRTSVETLGDASLHARGGILVAPNVLLYGTGGVAFQQVKETIFCGFTLVTDGCIPTAVTSTFSKTLIGPTAGAGIEASFWGNWLARGEYRYADFGTLNHSFALGPTAVPGSPTVATRIATHIVSFGLGYKFGPPVATDLVSKMPVKAPVVGPSWTGLHVGLALGARRTDADWTTTALTLGALPPLLPDRAAFDNIALRVGGYAGFDYQIDKIVLGVEGSVGQGIGAKKTMAGIPGEGAAPLFGFPFPDNTSVATGWDGSITGRFGVLIAPNALLYGAGGVAFQRVTLAANCFAVSLCLANHAESISATRTGPTGGGGIEVRLAGHWFTRFDYRYADFGMVKHVFFTDEPLSTIFTSTRIRTHTASFGLAYQFH
jgi:outer membrane immunogenic protein